MQTNVSAWADAMGLRPQKDMPHPTKGRRPAAQQWAATCRDKEHSPPSMLVLPEGTHEHVCPGCGLVTRFTVQRPSLAADQHGACGTGSSLGFELGEHLGSPAQGDS